MTSTRTTPTAHRAPRDQRIQTACLLILTGIALALSLYWLKGVMVPFVLAIFLSFALAPLIDLLIRRARLPRALALIVTIGLALALLLVFGNLVTSSLRGTAQNLDRLEAGLIDMLERGAEALRLDDVQRSLSEWTDVEETGTSADGSPETDDAANEPHSDSDAPIDDDPDGDGEPPTPDADPKEKEDAASLVAEIGRRVVPALGSVLNGITNLLSKSVLVIIFLMFLLVGRHRFDIREDRTTLGIVERQVRTYLVTKILASLATGILTAIALRLIGVPSAMLFGLFAFLLNFIPSIGSILAALLPLPIALVHFDVSTSEGVLAVILTLTIPGSIQFVIGNVIEPKVMGNSLDLHPVVVMLSLIFWGTIWGPIGMLLAVPITAVIKLMLERLEPTHGVARAMAGKLTP